MEDKRKKLRQLEKELFELKVKRIFLNREIKRQMDKWQD
tara:strand:+ start:392 stop:508 length:117 start_codon:yes stop_codon:yes gene_type:complete